MFGIGGSELLLILVLALIIFGPDKLPGIARNLGRTAAEFKKAASDFERSLEQEGSQKTPEEIQKVDQKEIQKEQETSREESHPSAAGGNDVNTAPQ